jgi:hypothetical protein
MKNGPARRSNGSNVWDWADRKRLRLQAESIRFDFQSLTKNFPLKKIADGILAPQLSYLHYLKFYFQRKTF